MEDKNDKSQEQGEKKEPPWKKLEEEVRKYKANPNFVPNKGRNFTPRYSFPSQRRFGR
ncbi:MAG: hypothetical protein WCX27_00885 [Candidatus Paceibacterota bacterium]|jgi:hypothetical protein